MGGGQKNESGPYLVSLKKIRHIAVLNMGGETIKLLEDTIHFFNSLGLGKDFLSRTQKALPLEKKD